MEKMRGKVALPLLAVALIWLFLPFPANAQPLEIQQATAGVTVSNETELGEALNDEGVTDITLTNDIVISGSVNAWVDGREVTVHLGAFSIVLQEPPDGYIWSMLDLAGSITIRGSGTGIVQQPGSYLFLSDGVRLEMEGDGSLGLELHDYTGVSLLYMEVAVSGRDAVGILGVDVENPFLLRMVRLTAEGDGASAARFTGTGNILVEQSTLESEGGSALDANGDVYAYRSILSTTPAGAHVEHGTFDQSTPYKLHVYPNFEKGPDELWLATEWRYRYTYEAISPLIEYYMERYGETEEGADSVRLLPCPLEWDVAGFDASAIGTHTIKGKPTPPIALPGLPLPDISCEVTVLSAAQPWLNAITLEYDLENWDYESSEGEPPLLVDLWLLAEIPDAQELVVWCTTDSGETWSDISNDARFDEDFPELIHLRGLAENTSYHFCVEVRGGTMQGFTNAYWIYTDRAGGQGGDRHGYDREDEDIPMPPGYGDDDSDDDSSNPSSSSGGGGSSGPPSSSGGDGSSSPSSGNGGGGNNIPPPQNGGNNPPRANGGNDNNNPHPGNGDNGYEDPIATPDTQDNGLTSNIPPPLGTLGTPAETNPARSKPLSPMLPIALGGGAALCGLAAQMLKRRRVTR